MRSEGVVIFGASAEVAELVDALDLGSSGAIRGGSSPPFGTRGKATTELNLYESLKPNLSGLGPSLSE